MTLRRQTPLMLRILSPPKVRAVLLFFSSSYVHVLLVPLSSLTLFSLPRVRPSFSLDTQRSPFHLDDSDALSAASCHDGESERFRLHWVYRAAESSFNESALYEQEKGDSRQRDAGKVQQVIFLHYYYLGELLVELDFDDLSSFPGTLWRRETSTTWKKGPADPPSPASGPVWPEDPHHHGVVDSTESSTVNINQVTLHWLWIYLTNVTKSGAQLHTFS